MVMNSPILGGDAMPQGASLGEASPPQAPPPAPSFPDKMLSQAQARFDAVAKASKQLGRVRKGLDALAAKGDAVTSDDVLDEMASLVAHGADPKVLAAMIAGNTQAGVPPMPQGGQPLAGWLTSTERDVVAPAEARLRPALALAQHQLGVAAVHKLVEVHAKAQGGGTPQNPGLIASPSTSPSTSTPSLL